MHNFAAFSLDGSLHYTADAQCVVVLCQFEREVTGERIRDKIAASKKKGMCMGGNVPLGYDASECTLVIATTPPPR